MVPRLPRFRTAAVLLLAAACSRPGPRPAPLTAAVPLHLEEHLAQARVTGSTVPAGLPAAVEWRFDAPGADSAGGWTPVAALRPGAAPPAVRVVDGALRLSLTEAQRQRRRVRGGVYVELPGWNRQDWAFVRVRARADAAGDLTLAFNRRERAGEMAYESEPFRLRGESVPLVGDGTAHDYLLRADWINGGEEEGEAPWRQLGLMVSAAGPAEVDLLAVSVIPKEARYGEEPVGLRTELRQDVYRRSLFVHTPATVEYTVRVPEKGRLDFGLGVLRRDAPVTFRVALGGAAGGGEERAVLFEETQADPEVWRQRSVDLSRWAGKTVRLFLETAPARTGPAGTLALWAAPTLSGAGGTGGARAARPPNVILYVIDAGSARFMSAYGYGRRTTPNLERLAAQGALFERAYSNSTWSKPSTTSFMTGLQHSVLGGFETPADPLPEGAPTMAELLHRAGYQTGVFTSNTWCGTLSGLDRGVDQMRETVSGDASASSAALHAAFWRWRESYPGRPYWVHFQTTDVHWPWGAEPPVAGLFLSRAERAAFYEMERRLGAAAGTPGRSWGVRASAADFERAGVDRAAYFDGVRGAYDEALAHNDLQLGRLVERLKATGEWEDTVLIVTADHGDWPGLGLFDPAPGEGPGGPSGRIPYLNPYLTQVPLVVVWPARIAPGQRFRDPVSLIDLLPTVLDLTGQTKPEHLQGQSLAPLLLGQKGWEPRPVVLDEFVVAPGSKALTGNIEIVDGRWGASLAVGPPGETEGPRLLLYDLWEDPDCRRSVHQERPEVARQYMQRLERLLREHLQLAKRFRRTEAGTMNSRQLETLRSLGYVN